MDADVGMSEIELIYMKGPKAHSGFPEVRSYCKLPAWLQSELIKIQLATINIYNKMLSTLINMHCRYYCILLIIFSNIAYSCIYT